MVEVASSLMSSGAVYFQSRPAHAIIEWDAFNDQSRRLAYSTAKG